MTHDSILQLAEQLGIRQPHELSVVTLARRIQVRLGEEPCCGTEERDFCHDQGCRWWSVCHRRVAIWQR